MSDTALLVIDMLNAYHHEDADKLVPSVTEIVDPLADLIRRGREHDEVDVIYVNDNYGEFAADRDAMVRQALDGKHPELIEPILPEEKSLFLQKVRHSAFYATSLAYLLNRLETKCVVLTGQVTEQCILYSALDAYVRHFAVMIPDDAVAHIDPELGRAALKMMEANMRAKITSAADCLS